MSEPLSGLDSFDLLDAEAADLDRYLADLPADNWVRPSRCAGWRVRDVLAHLAGEELYNHACLDDDLAGFSARLSRAGVGGLAGFNDWCVAQRRDLPVADVLAEWRDASGRTRRELRARGAEAMLPTQAGPYPVGLQAFHLASETATHADDMHEPTAGAEEPKRSNWRARFGWYALREAGADVRVTERDGRYLVSTGDAQAQLSEGEFVEATVDRLATDHPLPAPLRRALVCLA